MPTPAQLKTINKALEDLEWEKLGTNIHTANNGKYTYFRFDIDAERSTSQSGKSELIASTRGNKELEIKGQKNIYAGINIYQKI